MVVRVVEFSSGGYKIKKYIRSYNPQVPNGWLVSTRNAWMSWNIWRDFWMIFTIGLMSYMSVVKHFLGPSMSWKNIWVICNGKCKTCTNKLIVTRSFFIRFLNHQKNFHPQFELHLMIGTMYSEVFRVGRWCLKSK